MKDSLFTNMLDGEQKKLLATAITGWAIGNAELTSKAISADDRVASVYDVFANFFGFSLSEFLPHLKTQYTIEESAVNKDYEGCSFEQKCKKVKSQLLVQGIWCENMHKKFHIQVMPEAIDEFLEFVAADGMKVRLFMNRTLNELKFWFNTAAPQFLNGSLVWADRNRTNLGDKYYMHNRNEC